VPWRASPNVEAGPVPTDPDVTDGLRRRAATAVRLGALELAPDAAHALGASSSDEAIQVWLEHPHRWSPPVHAIMESRNVDLLLRVVQLDHEAAAKAVLANPHCRQARLAARGITSNASPRQGTKEAILGCHDAHPLADALEKRRGLLDDPEVLQHAVNVALRNLPYGGPVGWLVTPHDLRGREDRIWAKRLVFIESSAPDLWHCPLRDLPWRITAQPRDPKTWADLGALWPNSLFARSCTNWSLDVNDRSEVSELLAALAVAPKDLMDAALRQLYARNLVEILMLSPAFRALCPQDIVDRIHPESL
jgi:hypothetical protein